MRYVLSWTVWFISPRGLIHEQLFFIACIGGLMTWRRASGLKLFSQRNKVGFRWQQETEIEDIEDVRMLSQCHLLIRSPQSPKHLKGTVQSLSQTEGGSPVELDGLFSFFSCLGEDVALTECSPSLTEKPDRLEQWGRSRGRRCVAEETKPF